VLIVLVAVIALVAFTLVAVVVISVVLFVVLLGEDLYNIVSETISAGVTLFEQFASSLWTFMQGLGQDLATLADQLLRIGIYLAIPCATIALILKNNFYYGLVGFGMVGLEWDDQDKLMADYTRGVAYPVHVAYHNVQNIFTENLHLLDEVQL
jgi:hypothetical protein